MLASRRPATSSCARESKNGAPARMSLTIRTGASSSPTGAGIRPRPRCDVGVATSLRRRLRCRPQHARAEPARASEMTGRLDPSLSTTPLVWQAPERVVRRLLLPGSGEETRLPAAQATLVAEQEPEHHRNPRVLACHCISLR